jgi:predicted solute-binding protein
MHQLRVGIVDFLNSRPLAWGFLEGRHGDLCAASYHPPAEVARRLAEGSLDAGLIPSIEVPRIGGLEIVPRLCVSATHEVRSVLLVSRRPLARVRRIALDANSRTSAALTRILAAERWGIAPEYVEARPDVPAMLAGADAALLIGDPALQVDRERYLVVDLAAEWQALTGLPFVFAVWAVRPEAAARVPNLGAVFAESLRYGLDHLDDIVARAAAELSLPADLVHAYLTENLGYVLGEPERAGLDEFWRRARVHGLIDDAVPAAVAAPAAG